MNRPDPYYTVHNQSNGPVGIQAAHVTGSTVSMHFGASINNAEDLTAALTELRQDLENAHANGQVDRDTYQAASDELDTADTTSRENDPKHQSRTVLALKRFGGLMSSTADIASKVTALITAIGQAS